MATVGPAALTDLGIGPAVQSLTTAMPIPVEVTGTAVPRLEPTLEYTVYLLVKEAFANMLKHGHATHAAVRLQHTGAALRVCVTDNGKGGASADGGRGLLGLQDRVHAIGGTFTVTSPPGEGTVVAAILPCQPVVTTGGADDAGQ